MVNWAKTYFPAFKKIPARVCNPRQIARIGLQM